MKNGKVARSRNVYGKKLWISSPMTRKQSNCLLRLGLPGGSASDHNESTTVKGSAGKRGFRGTASVDLKLSLFSSDNSASDSPSSVSTEKVKEKTTTSTPPPPSRANDPAKPPVKRMASNRGQGGIQQLLAAEQEAQRTVNEAKIYVKLCP